MRAPAGPAALSWEPVQECVEAFVVVRHPLRVLLLRRAPNRGDFWQPVSGKVEPSDTSYAAAALRETEEETGFTEVREVIDLGWSLLFLWDGKRPFRVHGFAAEVPVERRPLLSREHQAYRWCSPSAALSLLFHPDNREALLRLQQRIGP